MRRILRDLLARWLYEERYDALHVATAGLIGLMLGVAWMLLVTLLKGD